MHPRTKHSRAERVRRRVGSAAAQMFFEGLARVSRLHPRASPAAHVVKVIKDVAYLPGAHPAHRLDVWQPAGPGPWPVVLYVHGGAFKILSKETHWVMALSFARRGYLVLNAEYRLAPRHPFPAGLQDVFDAWRFAVTEAARFGGDTGRGLVVAGESAGANLVTALTLACCFPREEPWARRVFDLGRVPDAVVPACGLFQVSDPERFGRRRPLPRWLLDRIVEVRDAYLGPSAHPHHDLADPVAFLERAPAPARPLPPFFLPVGTADPILDDTRRMHAALTALGAASEARYYPGEPHAFHALVFREAARRCWRDTFDFLDRNLPSPPRDAG